MTRYVADALESVRAHVQHDMDGLYLFQMQHAKTGDIVPDILGWGEVEVGNVDSGDHCKGLWSLLQPAFIDLQSRHAATEQCMAGISKMDN